MKNIIFTGTAAFILGIVLGLIQLWFEPWRFVIFLKLELTLGALFLINLAIGFTRKEYKDYKRQQDGDKLDD
ncbi:MAG: hypothetical protein WC782_13875 [Methylococcaceae bacterium]|jgi:hypothetical protein